jgi:hypothetical protein
VKPVATPWPRNAALDPLHDTIGALATAFVVAHLLVVVIVTAPLWFLLRRYL